MFFSNSTSISNKFLTVIFCILQLCTGRGHSRPRWQLEATDVPVDELEPNPVVQGVKLIMVSVIFLVHSLKTSAQNRNSLYFFCFLNVNFFKSISALIKYHSPFFFQ